VPRQPRLAEMSRGSPLHWSRSCAGVPSRRWRTSCSRQFPRDELTISRQEFHTSSELQVRDSSPLQVPGTALPKKPLLPSSLSPRGPKSLPPRIVPANTPPSGSKRRPSDALLAGGFSFRTPEEERKKREAKERRYHVKVIQPLLQCWQRLDDIIREFPLDRHPFWYGDAKYLVVAAALREGKEKGKQAYIDDALSAFDRDVIQRADTIFAQVSAFVESSEKLLADLREAREKRIADALARFEREVIEPATDIIERGVELDHAWEMLLADIRQAKEEIPPRAMLLEHELARLKSEHGTQHEFSNIINAYRNSCDDLVAEISGQTLRNIKLELIFQGKWALPVVDSKDPSLIAEWVSKQPIDPKFFRGAATNTMAHALKSLLWLKWPLEESTHFIRAEAHRFRSFELTQKAVTHLPEIFSHRIRAAPGEAMLHQHYHDASLLHSSVCSLRELVYIFDPRRIPEIYNEIAVLCHKLKANAHDMQREYATTFCSGLSPAGPSVRTPLKRVQVSNFCPVLVFIHRYRLIRSDLSTFRSSIKVSPSRRQSFDFLSRKDAELSDEIRGLWHALQMAVLWRSAAHMYHGIVQSHSVSHDLMRFVEPVKRGTHLSLPPPTERPRMPPPRWLQDSSLYPLQGQIPIDYVITRETAFLVARKFMSSKVVGVDAIVIRNSPYPGLSVKPRVEFLMLANEERVSIFHVSVMKGMDLFLTDILPDIFRDEGILKVGVNMEMLRHVFAEDLMLDMVAAHNLGGTSPAYSNFGDTSDSNHDVLSDLALQHFGKNLPRLSSLRTLQRSGAADPGLYFNFLALRPYAALQIFLQTSSARQIPESKCADSRPAQGMLVSTAAELGPVWVDSLWPRFVFTYRIGRTYPHMIGSRGDWLKRRAGSLARSMLEERKYFGMNKLKTLKERKFRMKDLQDSLEAYYLATTFDEPTSTISEYVQLPRVAGSILAVADKAQLPLTEHKRRELEAEKTAELQTASMKLKKSPLSDTTDRPLGHVQHRKRPSESGTKPSHPPMESSMARSRLGASESLSLTESKSNPCKTNPSKTPKVGPWSRQSKSATATKIKQSINIKTPSSMKSRKKPGLIGFTLETTSKEKAKNTKTPKTGPAPKAERSLPQNLKFNVPKRKISEPKGSNPPCRRVYFHRGQDGARHA